MPFLRHLMIFYNLLQHLDLTQSRHVFFNYTISVFQTQYSIFCCFFFSSQMNFSLNERGTTEKQSKMLFLRFLRPFTAMKWELNTTLCFENLLCVCLGSNFLSSGSFRVNVCVSEKKTQKMVKNAILTVFYGIK